MYLFIFSSTSLELLSAQLTVSVIWFFFFSFHFNYYCRLVTYKLFECFIRRWLCSVEDDLFCSLVGLLALVAGVNCMYSAKSDVVELTPKNFDKLVIDSNEVWVVEFYAPWCGHCKQLTADYDIVATALKVCKSFFQIFFNQSIDSTRHFVDVIKIFFYRTVFFCSSRSVCSTDPQMYILGLFLHAWCLKSLKEKKL